MRASQQAMFALIFSSCLLGGLPLGRLPGISAGDLGPDVGATPDSLLRMLEANAEDPDPADVIGKKLRAFGPRTTNAIFRRIALHDIAGRKTFRNKPVIVAALVAVAFNDTIKNASDTARRYELKQLRPDILAAVLVGLADPQDPEGAERSIEEISLACDGAILPGLMRQIKESDDARMRRLLEKAVQSIAMFHYARAKQNLTLDSKDPQGTDLPPGVWDADLNALSFASGIDLTEMINADRDIFRRLLPEDSKLPSVVRVTKLVDKAAGIVNAPSNDMRRGDKGTSKTGTGGDPSTKQIWRLAITAVVSEPPPLVDTFSRAIDRLDVKILAARMGFPSDPVREEARVDGMIICGLDLKKSAEEAGEFAEMQARVADLKELLQQRELAYGLYRTQVETAALQKLGPAQQEMVIEAGLPSADGISFFRGLIVPQQSNQPE